ncbi:ATP-binding cassette domain-containing protein, partial [Corynebacterium hesseae]|uniref:ATP-binding cassette domain-containing protein n=1 Tax=Corynebacterium hesseae TaxID=2913502 RepID=UPI00373EDEBC
MIELHDISQTFGNFHALRGINLSVKEGAVTCVLGDNGAGKSTLIKILAGLNQPTGGTITVDGEEVNFASPRDSLDAGIATVYQDLALVPSLSVWRNFFLGQELTGALGSLREEEMKRITHEQLSEMGIELGDVSVELSALSGGQRQVVAIAPTPPPRPRSPPSTPTPSLSEPSRISVSSGPSTSSPICRATSPSTRCGWRTATDPPWAAAAPSTPAPPSWIPPTWTSSPNLLRKAC